MQIKPFKAFRYDKAVVGSVADCIAPPYDVITPAQQQQLNQKSDYNVIRITKGNAADSDNGHDNQYTRAAEYFENWIRQGVLKQDPMEAIYPYIQNFELAGEQFQRLSFVALGKLEEFGHVVRPHEQIFEKPLLDRLNLKRATKADFGLVFLLYEDQQEIADNIIIKTGTMEPLIDFIDEQDVRHRLFAITDKEDIKKIVKMMKDKSCVIADGHHRYTTGLTYSRENSDSLSKYQMFAFANISHKGLVVLATHRLVGNLDKFSFEGLIHGLKENFELVGFTFDSPETKTQAKQKMLERMRAEHDNDKNAFGIYGLNHTFYVAVLKDKRAMDHLVPDMSLAWRTLDVSVLHKMILEQLLGIDEEILDKGENLQFVKDTPNAIDQSIAQIDQGQKQVAFFMSPIKLQQLKKVTDVGERMPQKSTYFFPKVYTGLTIQKI